jgi:hypothetical protein
LKEPDAGHGPFVGDELDVRDAAVIVDGDMDKVPALT